MKPEEFCYWLQGLLELQPDLKELTPEQVKIIRTHLGYVFDTMHPPKAERSIHPRPSDGRLC